MEGGNPTVEIDPDYESTNKAVRDAQIREEQSNQLTEEKLHHIIKDEFDKELKIRQKQIDEIEDKIFKAQKLLHVIRYVLISSYYQNKALEYESMEYEGSNILNGQNRIHPAVKKLLGGNVKTLDFLAPLGKRKTTAANGGETTVNEPKIKKPKLDLDLLNAGFTTLSTNKPKSNDITIKHTDQEILTNRKKVQHQIVVGNTSLYKKTLEYDNLTHKWMVYIKVFKGIKKGIEVSNIISRVIFHLHPSYSPHDVVEISQPPFHLSRRGWGEFPLRVQIYFKSSINKPVDVIHHLKLSKTFTERQTLANETTVPIFLYDTTTSNSPTKKQYGKVKQEKLDVPDLEIKNENLEPSEQSLVQIKQECLWESVENLVSKQELDQSYLEPALSSDVDSYFDNRDSFSENMSETNDIVVSYDSWEQGFKGFNKEDQESGYYSLNGRKEVKVDETKYMPNDKILKCDYGIRTYSNVKKEIKKENDLEVLSSNNYLESEANIDVHLVPPEYDRESKLGNNDEKNSIFKERNASTDSTLIQSNIKTNFSIQEHSYSLPYYKEETGTKKYSPKKSLSIKQAPNNLIFGLGPNYESSTVRQKQSPQILKVLRTASGQSIRLLPESFSQILLSNGGIVQLKLMQNQDSPDATMKTYAISNSDLLKLNLKPVQMPGEKVNRHRLKFPKENFKSMGEALPYLFKQLPLWSDKAKELDYKALFPFTATSREEFVSWTFAKRVNSEWIRARTIKSILSTERYSERWNTKAILMYGRSHFDTPLVQYNMFTSDICPENKLLADVFNRKEVGRRKFSYNENGNDPICVVDDIDLSSKPHPPKQVINLIDQKRIRECAYVKEQALSCGVLLKQEELCRGVYMNAAERVMLEGVKSFAEGLIRRARYFAVSKGKYSDSVPLTTQEVLAALNDRPDFKSIEKFQKTKITKDFFS